MRLPRNTILQRHFCASPSARRQPGHSGIEVPIRSQVVADPRYSRPSCCLADVSESPSSGPIGTVRALLATMCVRWGERPDDVGRHSHDFTKPIPAGARLGAPAFRSYGKKCDADRHHDGGRGFPSEFAGREILPAPLRRNNRQYNSDQKNKHTRCAADGLDKA